MKVRLCHAVLAFAVLATLSVVLWFSRDDVQGPVPEVPAEPPQPVVKPSIREALSSRFVVEIHKRGSADGPVVAILPERHNEAEKVRVLELLEEIDQLGSVDVLALENYIAPPKDAAWDQLLEPLAAVLKKPPKDLHSPAGTGRYDGLFNERWKSRLVCLEAARPQAFLDSALMLEVARTSLSLKRLIDSGFEPEKDDSRLIGVVTYLRQRYPLPAIPETVRERRCFRIADIKYIDDLFAAAGTLAVEVSQKERDQGMAEILASKVKAGHKLIVVIIGSGHVTRNGMPELLKQYPLLTEVLAPQTPENVSILSVWQRR